MFGNLKEFFDKNLVYVIIGVFFILVIGIGILILTKKFRTHKKLEKLKATKKDLLDNKVPFQIEKISTIGLHNVLYMQYASEYKKEYNDLIHQFLEFYNSKESLLESYINQRDFLAYKNLSSKVYDNLKQTSKKIKELENKLNKLLLQEEDIKEKEKVIRIQISKCKNLHNQKYSSLSLCEKEVDRLFIKVDNDFLAYTEYVNHGNYNEAKQIIDSIDNQLRKLETLLNVLPNYCYLVTKELPEKVNKFIDNYSRMKDEGYPLYQLLAGQKINNMKEDIYGLVPKLKAFNFDTIDEISNQINKTLDYLNDELIKEESSRKEYEAKFQPTYDEAEKLIKQHIDYIKRSVEMRKKYESGSLHSELTEQVKIEVQKLQSLKKIIDSFSYGEKQYSYRLSKLNELANQVNLVRSYLSNSDQALTKMDNNSTNAFSLVNDANVKLKAIELEIRNSRYDAIRIKFMDVINNGYILVEKLALAVNRTPIDAERVDQISKELSKIIDLLETDAHKMLHDAKVCEELLLYANSYRSNNADIARDLSQSEQLFYSGGYEASIALTKTFLRRFPLPEKFK